MLAFALLQVPVAASAQDRWSGFYSNAALERTANQTAPDIAAIFEIDLPRVLTPEERARLAGVRIVFPREDPSHPANFFARPSAKLVHAPLSSIRFLRDMAIAYAWLSVNKYDLQPVTDYLCMIKYQWPDRLRGNRYTPLDALGVPQNALSDAAVMARFQQVFGTMIVFVLGHELGHIYHQHAGYDTVTRAQARLQEEEADRFALSITSRLAAAPVGASLYFHIAAHLESFPGDSNFRQSRRDRVHPLSAARVDVVARDIEANAQRYGTGAARGRAAGAAAAGLISAELQRVARVLGDEGTQAALRRIGLSTSPELLHPRRVGDLPRLPGEAQLPSGAFSGTYIGKWLDSKGTDLDVKLVLNRNGERVTGSYTLFTVDSRGRRQGYGSSVITVNGTVQNGVLEYEWRWGTDYFGGGRLHAHEAGNTLGGTWGYTRAISGGGTWQLRRAAN